MKHLSTLFLFFLLGSCANEEPTEVKTYAIDKFVKNISVFGDDISNDNRKILMTSNEPGIFNLFEIDIEDGSKKQITNSEKESFYGIGYVPNTEKILYSADKGGNEIDHIYLLEEDGSSLDLTPGEEEKVIFFDWDEDQTHFYYESNKRNPQVFDLYKMSISNWEPEMVYQNDEGLVINDMTFDESAFCVFEPITSSENKLYLIDSKDNSKIEISKEPGSYFSAGFSKDNRFFYFITDAGKEFSYLNRYDIASGVEEIVYETDWDVMYSYESDNEKYRVIAINEDGKNNIIILDNESGKPIFFPEIKDGDITSVSFSKDESLLLLTIGTSKAPSNLYIYNISTQELKKMTETLNPDINPDDLVSAEVIRYKSFDGIEIPAIYYQPKLASKKNRVPALVWVHGGPGGQSRVGFNTLIQYLVNHGYAVLAVNNRGSSGYGKTFFKMDDQNHGEKDLQDCIWGKKWLQQQEIIDPNKVGIIGGSYGGFMVMAAMTNQPDAFEIGINLYGVTNWLRTLRNIPPWWGAAKDALYAEMGDPATDSVRLYRISPLFHADNISKPIMVLQGAKDPRVLKIESDEIVEAIKANNVPVEYVLFEDEGHGFVKTDNRIEAYSRILKFADVYLKNTPPKDGKPLID